MRAHTADHPFPTSGNADYLLEREQTMNRMFLARTCAGIEIDDGVVDELTVELQLAAIDGGSRCSSSVGSTWGCHR